MSFSGLHLTPSPKKKQSRMSITSSQNTLGHRSTMSSASMSFQRTQSMGRPMSGTHSNTPISNGVPVIRRPVTAVDFGETTNKPSVSVRSKATVESLDDDWFPEHNEASVCLVVGSDDSEDDAGVDKEKTSEDTLRDMVKTANEYFSRSAIEGGNWWE